MADGTELDNAPRSADTSSLDRTNNAEGPRPHDAQAPGNPPTGLAWQSFLALGDSFTEGLQDIDPVGNVRGWTDRLAGHIAVHNPDARYANLAVRGKLIAQVVSEQVP